MSARDAVRSCVGEPISWLRLERYLLDELPAAERRAVQAHLGSCAACAACLTEAAGPALPARAPADLPARRAASVLHRWLLGQSRSGIVARATALSAATAAIALAVLVRPTVVGDQTLRGSKGGGVAVELLRERDGIVEPDATTFSAGDRWKALVTCPAERLLFWEVAVFEAGQPSFPLSAATPIACGNHVPLPGAFRLEGNAPVDVCVLLGANPIDRRQLTSPPAPTPAPGTAHPGDEGTICVKLQPR